MHVRFSVHYRIRAHNKQIKKIFNISGDTVIFKFIFTALLCFSFSTLADESAVLNVDRSVTANIQLSFPNENNIEPKESDFEVVNYVLMSNEIGERFAVITLFNTSSGNRVLEHKHIMALFADGFRRSPSEIKLNFSGNETQSTTISFGESKFPILTVYSNNE